MQSSTILLMACQGEEPVDAAIFADTGWEPWWVYQHLDGLERIAQAAGIPVYRVGAGDLRADALDNKTQSWMPLYSVGPDGLEKLKRQCTRNYKIRPIRRKARELTDGKPFEQLVGISLDASTELSEVALNELLLQAQKTTTEGCSHAVRPTPETVGCTICVAPLTDGQIANFQAKMRDQADEVILRLTRGVWGHAHDCATGYGKPCDCK